MANYYTRASFLLPLKEPQITFALSVIDCALDENLDFTKRHKTKAAKAYNPSVFSIAKKMARNQSDYDQGGFYLDFSFSVESNGILIFHDESIDTCKAALFCHVILKHFDSNEAVLLNAAHTCSSARPDGFGGEAAFITKNNIRWMSTDYWLTRKLSAHQASLK